MKKSLAAAVTVTLTGAAVAGGTLLLAAPAHADIERSTRCAGADVELNVDREGGRFEVDADIDDAAPRSAWRIAVRHDGKVVHHVQRKTDREGDLDVDLVRPNTSGKDVFTLTVRPVGGKACTLKVATR